MFYVGGKYGTINIDGMSKDIEKTKIEDLKEYKHKLEEKRKKLEEEQNEYISELLN